MTIDLGASAPLEAAVEQLDHGHWRPLPRILYGFAVFPFAPFADDPESSNPHQVPLEIGSELYVFEIFRPSYSTSYNDQSSLWYRGYVVAHRQTLLPDNNRDPPSSFSSSSPGALGGGVSSGRDTNKQSSTSLAITEEPTVTVGIFPASHCLIKERLEESDQRLHGLRHLTGDDLASPGSDGFAGDRSAMGYGRTREPLAPLLEEEDEGDAFGNLLSSTKARNRASIADGRLSMAGTSATAAKKHRKSSSLTLEGYPLGIDENGQAADTTFDTQEQADHRPSPPLPSLKTGDETAAGSEEPLIDEIACALRESFALLYTYLYKRDYSMFQTVKAHIEALHLGRRQLLSKTLSMDEAKRLRRDLVDRLVLSNIQQGLDIVVRHPTWGALADVEAYGDIDERAWMSAVRMYRMGVELAYRGAASLGQASSSDTTALSRAKAANQSVLGPSDLDPSATSTPSSTTMAKNVSQASQDADTQDKSGQNQFYHVFIDLKAFVASICAPGEMVELIFSLYNKSENRFLTEEYCVVLNHQGVPLDGRLDRARTLFRDLSQQDILDTLVLVCRIVVNGHFKAPQSTATSRLSAANMTVPHTALSASFRGAPMSSTGSFDGTAGEHGLDGLRGLRRPFGCAVVEISQFSRAGQTSGPTELTMPIFMPVNEAAFSTLHEDIIASRIREFEKSPLAEQLTVGLRIFHDSVQAIARDNPSLMQETTLTYRLGFPDVVYPDDQRNDVYIKLWTGDFASQTGSGGKIGKAGVNIEVEAEVRTRNGTLVPNAVSRGTGQGNVPRFASMIFRNTATPTWGELIKLNIPFEIMSDCHVFFTFRNRRERAANHGITNQQEKPFAFAYLPLFGDEAAFVTDGSHNLVLYRHEGQWASSTAYLDGPATSAPEETLDIPQTHSKVLVPLRDTLIVRTLLCSTKITQDPTLLRLLGWEMVSPFSTEDLKDTLERLKYCPEFECIKMITQVFDALFAILASNRNEGGELDEVVFSTLVNLLGLVNDRRFSNFKPVLDVYIDNYFASTTAFSHLMSSLHRLIIDYANPVSAQSLRSTTKVWDHLFKIIIRSRQMQRSKEGDMDITANHLESSFKRDLKALLQSINMMMSATNPPSVIGTQTLAVQHFASIIPDLNLVFTSEEVADIAASFYDSIVSNKTSMTIQKVILLAQLSTSTLMQTATARSNLVPNICRWLKPHLGRFDELRHAPLAPSENESVRDGPRIAWLEGIRLSTSVIAALLDKLHTCLVDPAIRSDRNALLQEQDNVEFILSLLPRLLDSYSEVNAESTIEALSRQRSPATFITKEPAVFPNVYPVSLVTEPPSSTASYPPSSPVRHTLGEISAVIVTAIHISSPSVLASYLESTYEIDGPESCARLLRQLFVFETSLLAQEAYPATWLNISMLAHRSVTRLAGPVSDLLRKRFIPEPTSASTFNADLWKGFFNMLLKLLSSPLLVIEEFSPARQRAVWRLAGDLRGEGAKILLKSWDALSWSDGVSQNPAATRYGGYQVGMASMVGPVLELCLSHHDELRNTAVSILYSLVISEFYLNNNFHAIENEVLDRLDKLFSHRRGDEISRAFFITHLRALFERTSMEEPLRSQVEAFLNSINEFLDLLLGIRNLPEGEEWQDDRVIGTLKLMTFIEKRHRPIFTRYVHRLVDFHVAQNQFTEAGLTLKLHADLYDFNPSKTMPAMEEISLPQQTEFSRKELLLLRVLEYLSRGKAYESAITVSKVLQKEYEHHVFAYQRLSELLTHQADLFASIVTQTRQYPQTFRVGFFGRGFPVSVQNKQFVYRAMDWEKYGSFCERMQNKHPTARLLRTNTVPSVDIQNSDERYLVITPVVPEPDRSLPIFADPDVPAAVRTYYEHNETRTFSYVRPLDRADHSLLNNASDISHWTEKCYLVCQEAFPTILRRTEVVETRYVELSPIENALADVKSKTLELDSLYKRYLSVQQSIEEGTAGSINTNPLSMALNAAVDTGASGGIPLYRRAFFDSGFIAANPDKLGLVESMKEAILEQVQTIGRCLRLHQTLCPRDMASFHATLIRFFEKNFSQEIMQLSGSLDYRLPEAPLATVEEHPTSSPSDGNYMQQSQQQHQRLASGASLPGHARKASTATITAAQPGLGHHEGGGIATSHLPFSLAPLTSVQAIDHHYQVQPQRSTGPTSVLRNGNNLGSSISRSARQTYDRTSSYTYATHSTGDTGLMTPSIQKQYHSNGVHFAPTTSIPPGQSATTLSSDSYSNANHTNTSSGGGRSSPVPSTAASTVNGTMTSARSNSILSRFSSMKRRMR